MIISSQLSWEILSKSACLLINDLTNHLPLFTITEYESPDVTQYTFCLYIEKISHRREDGQV